MPHDHPRVRARHLRVLAVLLLGAIPAAATAQDSTRAVRLTGNLAYVDAAGNSDVTTFAFNQRLEFRIGTRGTGVTQSLGGVYGRTDGVTSASLWRAGLRGDVAFSHSVSGYALVGYDRDRFAGIARRVEEGLGLGVRVLHGPTDSLQVEGGLSFFQQRSTDEVSTSYTAARTAGRYKHLFAPAAYFLQLLEELQEGLGLGVRVLHGPTDSLQVEGGLSFFQQRSTDEVSTSYTAARTAGRYKHLFAPAAYFLQLLEVLPNLDDVGALRANSESALAAPISRALALRVSLVLRYDSDPPEAGVKKLDRLFTAGIEITF